MGKSSHSTHHYSENVSIPLLIDTFGEYFGKVSLIIVSQFERKTPVEKFYIDEKNFM